MNLFKYTLLVSLYILTVLYIPQLMCGYGSQLVCHDKKVAPVNSQVKEAEEIEQEHSTTLAEKTQYLPSPTKTVQIAKGIHLGGQPKMSHIIFNLFSTSLFKKTEEMARANCFRWATYAKTKATYFAPRTIKKIDRSLLQIKEEIEREDEKVKALKNPSPVPLCTLV